MIYCLVYHKIVKQSKVFDKISKKLKILTNVFQIKKQKFWKIYGQMFLKIELFEKWSDNFIKNQDIFRKTYCQIFKKLKKLKILLKKLQKKRNCKKCTVKFILKLKS